MRRDARLADEVEVAWAVDGDAAHRDRRHRPDSGDVAMAGCRALPDDLPGCLARKPEDLVGGRECHRPDRATVLAVKPGGLAAQRRLVPERGDQVAHVL